MQITQSLPIQLNRGDHIIELDWIQLNPIELNQIRLAPSGTRSVSDLEARVSSLRASAPASPEARKPGRAIKFIRSP